MTRARAPLLGVVTVAMAMTLLARPVRAEDAGHSEDTTTAEERPAVEWSVDWARVRPWEYAATSALMTEAFLVRFVGPDPPHDRGQVGLDVDITDAVAVGGTARDVAKLASDIGYFGSMAYRLVDSAILPVVAWGAPGVAWQMSWIDLESFAIVAGVLWNVQLVVGRERPSLRHCPDSPNGDSECESGDRFRAFIAGHVAVAAATAGLTCLHHGHMPLYGGGFGDDLACATTIGATAVVGTGRLIGEAHYASDVVLGVGLGVFAGYVVPSALHYGFGGSDHRQVRKTASADTSANRVTVSLLPILEPSTYGAGLVGIF